MKVLNLLANKKHTIILYVTCLACILLLSFTVAISYSLILSDKIYTGVVVDNIDSSRMTKEQLKNVLEERYEKDFASKKITLKADDLERTFTYRDIRVNFDIDKTVKNAFEYGRNGNFFSRFIEVSKTRRNNIDIPLEIYFEKEIIRDIIMSFYEEVLIEPISYELVMEPPYRITLVNGRSGRKINTEKALKSVYQKITNFHDGILHIPVIEQKPEPIDQNELYEKINVPPQNAKTEVFENQVKITSGSYGRKISEEDINASLSEIEDSDIFSISLPVTFIKPEITKEYLKSVLFEDSLAYFNTQFYTGDINNNNRKVNIILSTNKINGVIINPGDIFSFNKTVGPRTPDRGYKAANSYIAGEIVESTGGGICQVSSTLYNAVLFSDLKVLERYNHMFTVGYVPLGRDAAVAYTAGVDFRFKNNTNFPIKILGWVSEDNKVHFELIGTKSNPSRNIELNSVVIEEINPQVEKKYDDTLKKDKIKVLEEGMAGFVVDAFKIVKENGEAIRETKISRNRYNPYARKIVIGTKDVENEKEYQNKE